MSNPDTNQDDQLPETYEEVNEFMHALEKAIEREMAPVLRRLRADQP